MRTAAHTAVKPQKETPAPATAARRTRTASVAEAKAGLSSLLREVEQKRTEVTLIRRGIPVARIVPVEEANGVIGYGWMRGAVTELGDIVGPSGEEWDVSDADHV